MGTRDRRKRRNRRRHMRALLELLLVVSSFGLLAAFAVYSIKAWEESKWKQAIAEAEGEDIAVSGSVGQNSEESALNGETDGYGTGSYAIGGGSSYDDLLESGTGPSQKGNILLEKPIKRTKLEVLNRLYELQDSYPKIQGILENKDDYPEEMLAALANNLEMVDFVADYKKTTQSGRTGKTAQTDLTKEEMNAEYPLFLQWDSRWGYASYGDDSNIGLAGCGPTCLSMVLYYKTRDASRTPDVLAAYAMRQGYYVSGTGTAWAFMEDAAKHYGLYVRTLTKSEEALKAALDRNRYIICAMGPGDFTAGGHFIVIYGYDEDGFLINDPNSRTRSEKHWRYDEISGQIKAIWSYS